MTKTDLPHSGLRSKIEKRCGKAAFDSPRIPGFQSTGSLILDLATRGYKSLGGFPYGKYVDVYGKPGCGKTALSLRAAKVCQAAGGLVVYVNTNEQGFNPEFADLIGVDTRDDSPLWLIIHAFSLESAWAGLEEVVEERYEADTPTLVIIDSISGAAVTAATMDGKSAKEKQASSSGAKFLHEAFRRGFLYYTSGSKITVVGIRHQTSSPNPYAGDTVTHGSAPEFYSWLQLKVTKEGLEDLRTGELTGSWVKVAIKRSKIGVHGAEVSMPFYFASGFNDGLEIVTFLQQCGAVKGQTNSAGGNTGRLLWEERSIYRYELIDLYDNNVGVRDQLRQMVMDVHQSSDVVLEKAKKKAGKR